MCQKETENSTSLTQRQLETPPYLVAAPSVSEASRQAKVARATLYRWMDDSLFRDEYERLRRQAGQVAKVELRGLMFKAVNVLAESMEDTNPFVRLRAAQATISSALKANDLEELEKRLDRITDALALDRERS